MPSWRNGAAPVGTKKPFTLATMSPNGSKLTGAQSYRNFRHGFNQPKTAMINHAEFDDCMNPFWMEGQYDEDPETATLTGCMNPFDQFDEDDSKSTTED